MPFHSAQVPYWGQARVWHHCRRMPHHFRIYWPELQRLVIYSKLKWWWWWISWRESRVSRRGVWARERIVTSQYNAFAEFFQSIDWCSFYSWSSNQERLVWYSMLSYSIVCNVKLYFSSSYSWKRCQLEQVCIISAEIQQWNDQLVYLNWRCFRSFSTSIFFYFQYAALLYLTT